MRQLKLGKYMQYNKYKCSFCDKKGDYKNHSKFITNWLCKECEHKLKFKINEEVYFLKENRDLNKLEIIKGIIIDISRYRELTYNIYYYNDLNSPQTLYVLEDYIFHTKEEAMEVGSKYGNLMEDIEVLDYYLMKKQSKLYDQICKFLKTDLAIEGNISGLSIKVEEGYVNAEWYFNKRKKGDIIE